MGSHTCSGTRPAFSAKPIKAAANTPCCHQPVSLLAAIASKLKLALKEPVTKKAIIIAAVPTEVITKYWYAAVQVERFSDSWLTSIKEATAMISQNSRKLKASPASSTSTMDTKNKFHIPPNRRKRLPS